MVDRIQSCRYKYLLQLASFALVFTLTAREAVANDLERAIEARDRAAADYVSAIIEQKPQENAIRSMREADFGVSRVLSQRHQENQNKIFNRTYFSDGSSMPLQDFNRDPQKYIDQHVALVEKKSGGGAGPSVGAVGAPSSSEGDAPMISSPEDKEDAPAVILDGSKIPKEINFMSKSKNADQKASESEE